jgi:hypothetical protein
MQYILLASVYFGGIHSLFTLAYIRGSDHLREDEYYLICTEELVRDFCSVIRVLLSKRRVVRLVSILSR